MLAVGLVLSPVILKISNTAYAAGVNLVWDANAETNLAGYKLYYEDENGAELFRGTDANEGDSPIIIYLWELSNPRLPTFSLTGLENDQFYYFTLTAFNTDGAESGFSEIVGTIAEENDNHHLAKGLLEDSTEPVSSGRSGVCFLSDTMCNYSPGSSVVRFGIIFLLGIVAFFRFLKHL
jgi:hypothetical protein